MRVLLISFVLVLVRLGFSPALQKSVNFAIIVLCSWGLP